jgi:hypothetical protein
VRSLRSERTLVVLITLYLLFAAAEYSFARDNRFIISGATGINRIILKNPEGKTGRSWEFLGLHYQLINSEQTFFFEPGIGLTQNSFRNRVDDYQVIFVQQGNLHLTMKTGIRSGKRSFVTGGFFLSTMHSQSNYITMSSNNISLSVADNAFYEHYSAERFQAGLMASFRYDIGRTRKAALDFHLQQIVTKVVQHDYFIDYPAMSNKNGQSLLTPSARPLSINIRLMVYIRGKNE